MWTSGDVVELGRLLRKMRKVRKVGFAEAATALRVSPEVIQAMERGDVPVRLFLRYCRFLRVKPKVRFTSTDPHLHRRLTVRDVRKIRALYDKGGITQKDLGARYGVHQTVIGSIILGKTWKDVPLGKRGDLKSRYGDPDSPIRIYLPLPTLMGETSGAQNQI